jgi:ADP-L-glycero-D-manno-heptose 6-epimerase
LQGSYQSFTEADMSTLKAAGYTAEFIPLEQGVPQYLDFLKHNGRP